jgi:hypothetical protein
MSKFSEVFFGTLFLVFETNTQRKKMNQAILLLLVVSSVYCGTGYHIIRYFEDSVCSQGIGFVVDNMADQVINYRRLVSLLNKF